MISPEFLANIDGNTAATPYMRPLKFTSTMRSLWEGCQEQIAKGCQYICRESSKTLQSKKELDSRTCVADCKVVESTYHSSSRTFFSMVRGITPALAMKISTDPKFS